MIVRTYKTRIGWNRWRTVDVYICSQGHKNKVIRNWSGVKPRGAFKCSTCSEIITIGKENRK